jgi:transcriptional regulator with XRE-family HTH domain
MPGPALRDELAEFLKSRRRQVAPETVGLVSTGHRRTAGLRREEVSMLSGVSLTWYTWLEQGRDIQPSRQVVDALARTLRLSTAEHAYLRRLTSQEAEPVTGTADSCPPHVQRLLDALGPSPAYAITPYWSIVGWNRAYAAIYPVGTKPPEERNLLWLVFTDPYVRRLLVDWTTDSRRFLTQFRSEAGPRLGEPPFAAVVERLRAASEHFRRGWASHDVDAFESRERRFEHPTAGTLLLEHHRLEVSDCPELHLVVYTAAAGSRTQRELEALLHEPPPT